MAYFQIQEKSKAFAKHVLAPELNRLDNVVSSLAALLQNPSIPFEDIPKLINVSLTELRYNGWERLHTYIRDLENQIKQLIQDIEIQDKKIRELVFSVEEGAQNIVKLYRETSNRNDTD